jgi:hypothetical protein
MIKNLYYYFPASGYIVRCTFCQAGHRLHEFLKPPVKIACWFCDEKLETIIDNYEYGYYRLLSLSQ